MDYLNICVQVNQFVYAAKRAKILNQALAILLGKEKDCNSTTNEAWRPEWFDVFGEHFEKHRFGS
jgi:hypothetical protein